MCFLTDTVGGLVGTNRQVNGTSRVDAVLKGVIFMVGLAVLISNRGHQWISAVESRRGVGLRRPLGNMVMQGPVPAVDVMGARFGGVLALDTEPSI